MPEKPIPTLTDDMIGSSVPPPMPHQQKWQSNQRGGHSQQNYPNPNQGHQGAVVPATQAKRFFNLIIDSFVLVPAFFLVNFIVLFAFYSSVGEAAGGAADSIAIQLCLNLFNCLGMWVYYSVFEAATGVTLGKLVTGTRVVAVDGSKPTVGQILGRSLCRFIPFEAFSFFGGQGRPVGWHDSISGTRVIETR